jgi:hypothetical protein
MSVQRPKLEPSNLKPRNRGTGIALVRKSVQRAGAMQAGELHVVREATTGQVVAMLPRIWAVAEPAAEEQDLPTEAVAKEAMGREPAGEALAFYRKYTEAMLRRYLRLSMQCGRVPSLLGRELFRGNVTHYKMHNFEDVVIFCHDMEGRLNRLERVDQLLIKRIALQQYSQGETAGALGISLRSCVRSYAMALDRLTKMLLADRMLEPQKGCQ